MIKCITSMNNYNSFIIINYFINVLMTEYMTVKNETFN